MHTEQTEATTNTARNLLHDARDPRIIICDGYDVKICIRSRQLHIEDGINTGRRIRRISRADGIKRVVVLTDSGFITLDAMRWCESEGITIAQYSSDGKLIMSSCPMDDSNPRMRLAQSVVAVAGMEYIRLDVIRSFIAAKLEGQANIASNHFGRDDVANRIMEATRYVGKASSLQEMIGYEGQAGGIYWSLWTGNVCISWTSARNLPDHWAKPFAGRKTGVRTSIQPTRYNRVFTGPRDDNRGAISPINAMLNYAYRIAETECSHMLLIYGLDPAIGFQHAIGASREALALDLLETVRPACDQVILDLIASKRFERTWCQETRHGIIKLAAPLTHFISESCLDIAQTIEPHVFELATTLKALRLSNLGVA